VAEARIEERQLLKTLRWYDGFVIALANPGFLLGSLGYTALDLGGWGSVLIWGIAAAIAVLINTIYSELAAMFPDKSGGLALYAHEAWRKYTTLVGPVATFGYWIGWSVVLSVFGLFIGQIIHGAWFSGEPIGSPLGEGYFSTGPVEFGLPHIIAIGLIVAVWLFNVFGARVGVTFGYAAGILLMIPLFVFMFLGFINGDWSSANMTWGTIGDAPWGGAQLVIVWLWIMCWSAWGVDTCATFAPEYKDTVNDTKWALRSAALFSLFVYILVPLGLIGSVGEETVGAFDYVGALTQLTGGSSAAADFFVVVICASFILSMNTATADGGRALYGISKDGMTIRQLSVLNKFHVPGTGMTVDMIVNVLFILFVGNIFGVLAASNLGYVAAHMFALSGFVLLRRDRPDWPRPIKLSRVWVPVAAILSLYCLVLEVIGFGWFQNAAGGYGGTKEKIIGLAVLGASILLFFFRRAIQDRERPHLREEVPTVPPPGYFEAHGVKLPAP
jgi:amino acid transporter